MQKNGVCASKKNNVLKLYRLYEGQVVAEHPVFFMVDKNDAKSKNNSSDTDEGVVLVMEDRLEPPKVRVESAIEFPKHAS